MNLPFSKKYWRNEIMKNTVVTFANAKEQGIKQTMLTAYDYSTAKLMDQAGVNAILVGDSLGMVCLGYEDTLSVTMEDMIHHTAAVARGTENALVVGDMPFMSYQTSVYDAIVNAGRLVKEGRAQAVKLEGGLEVADQIKAIVNASIPVMAHIGLTPQSVNAFGGFRVQGKTEETAQKLLDDARAVQAAGAFAVVMEGVPTKLAEKVTNELSIPTIGIGAGKGCDGQVLVYQDMLGMFSDFTPKFVKKYATIGESMKDAFKKYIEEVKNGSFPEEVHSFTMADDVLDKLY
jgi:3-methyl-2-oxobutanoate hydroxymethyltransferase